MSDFQFISFRPHQYLNTFIDYYWFGSYNSINSPVRRVSVVPIAMHNIVFNYGDSPYRLTDGSKTESLPSSFVKGIITSKQEYLLKGSINFISIRLRPLGLFRFFNVSPLDFTDENFEAKVFNRDLAELYDILGECINYDHMIRQLNQFFLKRLIIFEYKDQIIKPFQSYIDKVITSKGNIRVSSANYLSPRRFRTLFKAYTGISPKTFTRIIRFNFVYKELMKKGGIAIHSIIHKAGYYDQAHLIKEFKYFVQDTISNYRPNFTEFDEFHRF